MNFSIYNADFLGKKLPTVFYVALRLPEHRTRCQLHAAVDDDFGAAPVTFSMAEGAPPPGMNIVDWLGERNSHTPGTFDFTALATDAAGI